MLQWLQSVFNKTTLWEWHASMHFCSRRWVRIGLRLSSHIQRHATDRRIHITQICDTVILLQHGAISNVGVGLSDIICRREVYAVGGSDSSRAAALLVSRAVWRKQTPDGWLQLRFLNDRGGAGRLQPQPQPSAADDTAPPCSGQQLHLLCTTGDVRRSSWLDLDDSLRQVCEHFVPNSLQI